MKAPKQLHDVLTREFGFGYWFDYMRQFETVPTSTDIHFSKQKGSERFPEEWGVDVMIRYPGGRNANQRITALTRSGRLCAGALSRGDREALFLTSELANIVPSLLSKALLVLHDFDFLHAMAKHGMIFGEKPKTDAIDFERWPAFPKPIERLSDGELTLLIATANLAGRFDEAREYVNRLRKLPASPLEGSLSIEHMRNRCVAVHLEDNEQMMKIGGFIQSADRHRYKMNIG
jgi:hypothetical protein